MIDTGQRIGRIGYAVERNPGVWIWNVQVHLTGGLPMGTTCSFEEAKRDQRHAWTTLKRRTPPEEPAAAFRAQNIRGDQHGG